MARILLIEDDEAERILIRRAFDQVRFEIEEASTHAEALAALAIKRFDLILLDRMIPGRLDPSEDIRAIVNAAGPVPLLVISADESTESVLGSIRAGAQDYLPKSGSPLSLPTEAAIAITRAQLRDPALDPNALLEVLRGLIAALEVQVQSDLDATRQMTAASDGLSSEIVRLLQRQQATAAELAAIRLELAEPWFVRLADRVWTPALSTIERLSSTRSGLITLGGIFLISLILLASRIPDAVQLIGDYAIAWRMNE